MQIIVYNFTFLLNSQSNKLKKLNNINKMIEKKETKKVILSKDVFKA